MQLLKASTGDSNHSLKHPYKMPTLDSASSYSLQQKAPQENKACSIDSWKAHWNLRYPGQAVVGFSCLCQKKLAELEHLPIQQLKSVTAGAWISFCKEIKHQTKASLSCSLRGTGRMAQVSVPPLYRCAFSFVFVTTLINCCLGAWVSLAQSLRQRPGFDSCPWSLSACPYVSLSLKPSCLTLGVSTWILRNKSLNKEYAAGPSQIDIIHEI